MNNILAQLMQLYAAPRQGGIVAPPRQYPVPPYLSGPIDKMVVPPFGLPPDRNTIHPDFLVKPTFENL